MIRLHLRDMRYRTRDASGKPVTMEAIAAAIGVSKTSIWALETGRKMPSMTVLGKLCSYFRCQPGDLLSADHDLSIPAAPLPVLPNNDVTEA